MTTDTTPPVTPEQARARLEEIARWPDPDVPDLVYPLARFMAVRAQRAAARFLATTVPGGPDPDPVMVDALLDKFAALHLLVALRSVPHIASSAARDVVAVWRNGGATGPLIAKYCWAFGVDPDEVTRLEAVVAGGEGR